MLKNNFKRAVGVTIISGCLMACSSIEHRSERVAKQPLPTASALHNASKYWSNSTDKGSKNQAGSRVPKPKATKPTPSPPI